MIVQASIAALWLGSALAFIVFGIAVRRIRPGGESGTIAAIAGVMSALSLPALLSVPSSEIVALAAWLVVLPAAIAFLSRSRFLQPGLRVEVALASVLLVPAAWMFATSSAGRWEEGATLASRLVLVFHNIGVAALFVAAMIFFFRDKQANSRTAITSRPWAMAAFIAAATGILIDTVAVREFPLGWGVATWLLATLSLHAIGRRQRNDGRLGSVQAWGAAVAHGGAALAMAGFVASLTLADTRVATMHVGDRTAIGPWLIQLNSVTPAAGPGWVAIEGEIEASRGAGAERLEPQQRYELGDPRARSVPAGRALWVGRLSATLDPGNDRDGWPVRLTWRPFVGVVWVGLGLALMGALMIAAARGWRLWRRRPDPDWRRRSYE